MDQLSERLHRLHAALARDYPDYRPRVGTYRDKHLLGLVNPQSGISIVIAANPRHLTEADTQLWVSYRRQLSDLCGPVTQYLGQGHYAKTNWEQVGVPLVDDDEGAMNQLSGVINATNFTPRTWDHWAVNGMNEFTKSGKNEPDEDDLPGPEGT